MRGSTASTPVLGETGKKEAHVETVEQAGVKVGSLARREAVLAQEGLELRARHRVVLDQSVSARCRATSKRESARRWTLRCAG